MSTVFLIGRETRKFEAVVHKIAKLADFKRKDKSGNDKVVIKKIGNPLDVMGIGLLTGNNFDVFWIGRQDMSGRFQML